MSITIDIGNGQLVTVELGGIKPVPTNPPISTSTSASTSSTTTAISDPTPAPSAIPTPPQASDPDPSPTPPRTPEPVPPPAPPRTPNPNPPPSPSSSDVAAPEPQPPQSPSPPAPQPQPPQPPSETASAAPQITWLFPTVDSTIAAGSYQKLSWTITDEAIQTWPFMSLRLRRESSKADLYIENPGTTWSEQPLEVRDKTDILTYWNTSALLIPADDYQLLLFLYAGLDDSANSPREEGYESPRFKIVSSGSEGTGTKTSEGPAVITNVLVDTSEVERPAQGNKGPSPKLLGGVLGGVLGGLLLLAILAAVYFWRKRREPRLSGTSAGLPVIPGDDEKNETVMGEVVAELDGVERSELDSRALFEMGDGLIRAKLP
ncbi:hypothetical protein BJ508DRAFT_366267 [Ascobolus immersus RN42]|uniref:Mid2 domain-containing protein n=1 Tax=Ascobolus immersus RN42 TaxID=1160509 RepID=A0A3N4HN93_ASCIM|nr:hypothetical protein BJ508DRAFT_366267 [Ascobolus immersus RN42]